MYSEVAREKFPSANDAWSQNLIFKVDCVCMLRRLWSDDLDLGSGKQLKCWLELWVQDHVSAGLVCVWAAGSAGTRGTWVNSRKRERSLCKWKWTTLSVQEQLRKCCQEQSEYRLCNPNLVLSKIIPWKVEWGRRGWDFLLVPIEWDYRGLESWGRAIKTMLGEIGSLWFSRRQQSMLWTSRGFVKEWEEKKTWKEMLIFWTLNLI